MATALAIVDEQGVGALSMRALAGRLGVEAMSLYHHVRNKDALLTGVVESVMRRMDLAEPLPEKPLEVFEAMMLSFRRVLAEHPNAVPLVMTRPLATKTTTGYVDAPLRVLGEAGLGREEAGRLYQTAVAYTLGHAFISAVDPATPAGAPIRADDAAAVYPAIVGSGITPWAYDEAGYRTALGVIIRGFGALATER